MIIILILLIFFPLSSNAQNSTDYFQTKIDSINYYLSVYDTLSPFAEYESRFDLISATQEEIIKRLLEVLNDPTILDYSIENIFRENTLYISKSPDDKIYFLSIDGKGGGSWHYSMYLVHYRPAPGVVKARNLREDGGYSKVYELDPENGIYLGLISVTTCNTCVHSKASIIHLDSEDLRLEDFLDIDCRFDGLKEFDFNPAKKILKYEYNIQGEDSIYTYSGKFRYHEHAMSEMKKKVKPTKTQSSPRQE